MSLFVFGLGFSAQAAVAAMRDHQPGLSVHATTRDTDKAQRFRAAGITPHLFSGAQASAEIADALDQSAALLVSIAPGSDGDPVLAHFTDAIAASDGLGWMCYLSTIGVYGDAGGAWIDETYLGDAQSDRAKSRLAAEVGWQRLARQMDVPLLILRLAGIYGPGRSNIDKLRAGRAQRVVKPGQVFNRIHVEDIGRVVTRAAQQKLSGIYNLADDLPAPPQDVIGYAAELMGVEPPPRVDFEKADLSPMARAFYADNKRVSNQAIKQALGLGLRYPTYREGLDAILEAEKSGASPD